MSFRKLHTITKQNLYLFKYLGFLYESQSGGEVEYSEDHSSNQLNIERFLQGHADCWERTGAANVLLRKKIIISDWSYRYGMSTNFTLWKRLLNNGFEIYVWTGRLVKITSKEELMAQLKLVEPINNQELMGKFADNKLSRDECVIIDCISAIDINFKFDKRMANASSESFDFDLARISKLDAETIIALLNSIPAGSEFILSRTAMPLLSKPEVMNWLKNKSDNFCIKLDLMNEPPDFDMSLQEFYKQVKDIHFKTIEVNLPDLYDIIKDHPEAQSLILQNKYDVIDKSLSDIGVSIIRNIKNLSIIGSITSKDLSSILEECRELEELSLQSFIINSDLKVHSTTKLKKILIAHVHIEMEAFRDLLKKSPNLENLSILLLRSNQKIEDLPCENLKELNLISYISKKHQFGIMRSSPNVRKLQIDSSRFTADDMNDFHYPYLEELTYKLNNRAATNHRPLQAMINNSPRLIKLILDFDGNTYSENQLKEINSILSSRPSYSQLLCTRKFSLGGNSLIH